MERRVPAGLLLATWIALGFGLLIIGGLAWLRAADVQAWLGALQASYGIPKPIPLWARSDLHMHMLVSLLGTLWFGIGCRLFMPRALPWLPPAAMVLVALSDEIAQLGSAERLFEWSDQFGDALGISLAIPLVILLRSLRVGGPKGPPRT